MLIGVFRIRSDRIHCIVRDGAAVNTAVCRTLQGGLMSCVFPICLCHSVAIAGGELNIACSTARVVISIWATMIGHADTARRKFQVYAGVKAKRMGNVRWFTFWEVGAQLHDYYSAFKIVINDPVTIFVKRLETI